MIGLSFVHPEFLWVGCACVIPLAVHFLNRHQSRRFDFSTIRFFTTAAVQTSKIRTIKRWLLLLERIALLCVLAVVFARPYDKKDPFSALRSHDSEIFAFVDPTISMNYLDNGRPLWRRAFDVLDTLNKALSPSARRLLYNEQQGEFVPSPTFAAPDKFTRHGPALLVRLFSALRTDRRLAAGLPLFVYVSDFQENASISLDTQLAKKGDIPVICVSVAPQSPWNFGLQSVDASAANRSVVAARVFCQGRELHNAGITVTSAGMRIGHAVANGNERSATQVPIQVTSSSQNPCRTVSLDVNDPFPDDNQLCFVQGTSAATRVLVTGEPSGCFSVAAAFSALGSAQWNIVERDSRVVTYDDIDSASLIVLCGIRQASSPLSMFLKGASPGKKAILFAPAPDSANQEPARAIFPAWAAQSIRPASDNGPHAIVLPDTVSVLFSGFHSIQEPDAKVRSCLAGLPGAVLMRLDNSAPFCTQAIDSLGNSWIFLATPLTISENASTPGSLATSGLFVPLLDRLSRFALSAVQKSPQQWIAGIPAPNPFFGSRFGATVFDETGKSISRWSRQPSVVFEKPGLYRIAPDNDAAWWVGVGIDTSESDFSYRAPAEAKHVVFVNAKQFVAFAKNGQSADLSFWLWVVIGLLLVAEVLLWEKQPNVAKAK